MDKLVIDLTFDNPVFLNGDNYVVLRGTDKWEQGDNLLRIEDIRTCQIVVDLGNGRNTRDISSTLYRVKFMDIPETLLLHMQAPEARTYLGLLDFMRKDHPDFQEDEVVTVAMIALPHFVPKLGDSCYITVPVPEDERRWDQDENSTKVTTLTTKLTSVVDLGDCLWEISDGEYTDIVHEAQCITWQGVRYWSLNKSRE